MSWARSTGKNRMGTLSKDCYAYPAKELYPIHTKQAALNSYKEFQHDIDKYSIDSIKMIAANFIKAASVHDIKYPCAQAAKSRQCVDIQLDNGTVVSMTKIQNLQDADKAVAMLDQIRDTIELKSLRKVARYIVNECEKLSLYPTDSIKLHKYAGFGLGNAQQMAAQFRKRGTLMLLPESIKSQFYQAYRNLDQQDAQTMYKQSAAICDMLDGIDRLYKLESHYGNEISKPQDVCFSQTLDTMIKQASDYLGVESTSTILSKKALLQDKQKVAKFFADKYGAQIKDDNDMLNKVATLSSTGIKALIKELE